jgi:hypothetical protein
MRRGLFGSLTALVAAAGLALALAGAPLRADTEDPPAPAGPADCAAPNHGPPPHFPPIQPPAPKDFEDRPEPDDENTPPNYVWFTAEYLFWTIKGGPLPVPLATTGSAFDLVPGAIGQPGTRVVIGDQKIDYGDFSGGRFNAGFWLDPDKVLGFEGTYFFLGQRSFDARIGSNANGEPVIARPFIDAATGAQSAAKVAFPGAFQGLFVASSSSHLFGAEGNFVDDVGTTGFFCWDSVRFNTTLLAGFRYLELDEDLNLTQTNVFLPLGIGPFNGVNVTAPATVVIRDRFKTETQFYGGQVGARLEWRWGPVFADAVGKVALGDSHQVITISGDSTLIKPGLPVQTVPGGLLALPTNSGRFTGDSFAVVPEGTVRIGYYITPLVRMVVGYNFLYSSQVVRPGQQIDLRINTTQVPTSTSFGPFTGPAVPAVLFKRDDFWAQGLTIGFEFRY